MHSSGPGQLLRYGLSNGKTKIWEEQKIKCPKHAQSAVIACSRFPNGKAGPRNKQRTWESGTHSLINCPIAGFDAITRHGVAVLPGSGPVAGYLSGFFCSFMISFSRLSRACSAGASRTAWLFASRFSRVSYSSSVYLAPCSTMKFKMPCDK